MIIGFKIIFGNSGFGVKVGGESMRVSEPNALIEHAKAPWGKEALGGRLSSS
jgi:hypothetical protein